MQKGDVGRAIADDTEAIRLEPRYAPAYRGRGQLYAHQGRHDLAINDFTEAIRLDPANPQSYALRAKAYRALGDQANATSDERKAQELGN
jgi:Tfp pilus assembly protein PilF